MSDETEHAQGVDPDRAQLIASIYEVVLRPEHFSAFMEDWSAFIDQAARRLDALKIGEGDPAVQVRDPIIEEHFLRAIALFERMGREPENDRDSNDGAPVIGQILRGQLRVTGEWPVPLGADGSALGGLMDALTPDSALRLRGFLKSFDHAPGSGRFAVLSLADPPDTLVGGLLSMVSRYDREQDGFVIDIRALTIGWSPALAQVLVDSFSLTPREVELLRNLVSGGDLPALALRMGRSMNTLRTQLRAIFAKTRTHSQSELMRLVAVLMQHGVARGDPAMGDPVTGDGPAASIKAMRVKLPDGQTMTLRVEGAENGLPVIFIHGMLEGMGSFRGLSAPLAREGLWFLAPNRQNFGAGSHDPRLRDAPQIFAQRLRAVLDRMGIDRVILCGHLAGAITAFASAQELGSRCAGLVNVAGNVPIHSISQFETMTPRQRAVAYTARFAPALLPAIIHAGVAQIDGKTPQDFARSLYPAGTPDSALVADRQIAQALIEGYRYTVAQGIRGFQTDAWHVTRNWQRLVQGVRCPVLLIHGVQDRVVGIDSVRRFAQAHPRFQLQEIAGAGQLLLYGRPAQMAARIAGFAREHLGAPAADDRRARG